MKAEESNIDGIVMKEITISAPSLGNDHFNVSDKQSCTIFLPSNYNETEKNYPSIYFLHGFSTTPTTFSMNFKSIQMPFESVMIFPSGRHSILGGSFYTNSTILGNWEDFIVYDVVNYIDNHFRTLNDSKFRGIAGLSMGGYGAISIGMKYPEVFGSVYAISPGLFDENGLDDTVCLTSSMQTYIINLQSELFELNNNTEAHQLYLNKLNTLSFSDNKRFTLCYGTAFSPGNKTAPYLNYPYSNNTEGEFILNSLIKEQWWKGFGGISEKIDKYKINLLNLSGFAIEYATNDYNSWIPRGCQDLINQLQINNISHNVYVTNYNHGMYLLERVEKYMLPFFEEIFISSLETLDNSFTSIFFVIGLIIVPITFQIINKKRIRKTNELNYTKR